MKTFSLLMFVAAVSLIGCGGGESYVTDQELEAALKNELPTCTAGMVEQCPCPGGEVGVQTCSIDGRSWSACGSCAPAVTKPMVQKVTCVPNQTARVDYPGMTATQLIGVIVAIHSVYNGDESFSVFHSGIHNGYVLAPCDGDYDLFIGP